jgi:hypothetical protein
LTALCVRQQVGVGLQSVGDFSGFSEIDDCKIPLRTTTVSAAFAEDVKPPKVPIAIALQTLATDENHLKFGLMLIFT